MALINRLIIFIGLLFLSYFSFGADKSKKEDGIIYTTQDKRKQTMDPCPTFENVSVNCNRSHDSIIQHKKKPVSVDVKELSEEERKDLKKE